MNLNILPWRSLNTRVTVVVLAIFLAGMWLLAFYASRMLREDMQRVLGEQQFSTASSVAAQINGELEERLRSLETVAASITPAMLGKPADLQAFLEQRPVFRSLFNGGVVAFGRDGTMIVEHPLVTGRVGVNYMDRDHVAAALKAEKASIGRPVIGRVLKAPIFAVTVPIRDAQGQVIGALGGVINLGLPSFLDIISRGHYGKTGAYLLVAPQHRLIVTASDHRRIMEILPAPGVSSLLDRRAQGAEGTDVFLNPIGVEVLTSAKAVPVAGWYTAILLPTEEAFAPIRDMQRRMLLATIFLTLLAGGLTWWMLRRQLAPLLATAKTLAAMSDTNEPMQPLPIARQDEIGDLIGGFNRLLETLGEQQETLCASEARFRSLTELSSDWYWEQDRELRLSFHSGTFAQYSGTTSEKLRGKRRWEEPNRFPLNGTWDEHRATLEAHQPFQDFEYFRIGDNGERYFSSLSGVPIYDAAGEFNGYRGVGTSITKRKQAEEKLTALAAELEGKVALRTGELAKALEAATAADRMKTEFMANVTHELRTPLNSVIGFAELLKEEVPGPLNAKQSAFAADILASGERLLALVEGILEMSRLDAAGVALEREPVEIGAALEERVAAHRPAAGARGVAIELDVAADTGSTELDPKALRRMLDALLDNAIKFNRDGGAVAVSARRTGGGLEIAVADTGIGIAREDLVKLFKPLVQLNAGLARRHGGVGLGLALARRLAELHGGTLEVDSEPGKGSTFTLRFPVREQS